MGTPKDEERKRTYIRALLDADTVEKRMELKMAISKETGIPLGRISDTALVGEAIKQFYQNWFERGEKTIPQELLAEE